MSDFTRTWRREASPEQHRSIEAELAAIVDSSDDAIVGKTLDGVITSWNAGAERIFGYTEEEAIGQHITLIIPHDRWDEERDVLARVKRGERIDHFETVRRTKDGRRVDVSLTVSPIRNREGRIIGVSKVGRDITERKRLEAALREEVRVREILTRVGAALAVELDPDRLLQAVTDAATELTNAEVGVFVYNPADGEESYVPHTLSGSAPEAFEKLPQSGVRDLFALAFQGAANIRSDDLARDARFGHNAPNHGLAPGQLPVRSYLAIPVVSRSRAVLGALFFGHSRPAVFREKEEQIASGVAFWAAIALDNARLFRDAQEASHMKDQFLATLSHELRTPLNSVMGWAQLMQTGVLPAEMQDRALESIEHSAQALAQLVEDLLDVSRIVSGQLKVSEDEVNLGKVVASAVDTVRPSAASRDVELGLELPTDTDILVTGDCDRLEQVVWNLLTNAVKFTPATGRVDVAVHTTDSEVEVSVKDTGMGIAPEFQSQIFDRFKQADMSLSRKHGGLGIGLALVRQLTEAHGGTVSAYSAGPDRGSTFTVRLPLRATRPARHLARQQQPESSRLATVHALVVDDERDARDLLRTLLETLGARVTTAGSVGEALHALGKQPMDVLLADIGMPGQDGYALIRAVRALQTPASQIPAIAVTAYTSAQERARALQAGYDWHVPKPIDVDQLIALVSVASPVNKGRTVGRSDDRAIGRSGDR